MTTPDPITLTTQEIADILGITRQAAEKRARNEGWKYITKISPGRGGMQHRYLLTALPAHIQALYHKDSSSSSAGLSVPARPEDLLSPPAATTASAPVAAGGAFSPARRDQLVRSGLTSRQNDVASARYDLCIEYLQRMDTVRRRKKDGKKTSVTQYAIDFCSAYNSGMLLPDVFDVIGPVAVKTIAKWARLLQRGNYDMTVLAERYGQHRKGKREISEHELRTMLKWALHPNRLHVSAIIRNARMDLVREGTPCMASDATMRRALEDWRTTHYDTWVFAREGERALKNKALVYIERDSSLLDVGDVLVADGHPLNFQIINPWTGRPGRASLVLFFDWASRYPAGWQIMFSENVQCIGAALRRAIIALGKIPRACYLDNGKAFKAKVFTGSPIDLRQAGIQGVYARLGILTVFAKAYNPESKIVERFFSTFNDVERILPSYTGNSIADKPAWMMRNEQLHKKLHKSWIPTLDEAYAVISAWLLDEYATRRHSTLKRRPVDVWLEGKGTGVNEPGLRQLMMSEKIAKIGRNGVTFRGVNWWHEALYGYCGAALIRWDDQNMEEIDVYTPDGTGFICSAKPMPKMHPLVRISDNPLDAEALKQALKLQYSLKRRTEQGYRELADHLARPEDAMITRVEPHPANNEPTITPAEAEIIQAEASKKTVLSLVRRPDPLDRPEFFKDETDAYEWMLKCSLVGRELSAADRAQMAEFEQTELCRSLAPYWDRLRNEFADYYARQQTGT